MNTASPGGTGRFAPHAIGLEQFVPLLRETGTLIGTAPSRLCALFLLVLVPLILLDLIPYAAKPLSAMLASIGFAGFFAALESARRGGVPSIADMMQAWRLPADKIVLLAVAGLLPLLCVLLAWWADAGWPQVELILNPPPEGEQIADRLATEESVVANLVEIPFFFLQPLCVLFPWSGSRTFAANLLAGVANWRWVLMLSLTSILIELALHALHPHDPAERLFSLFAAVAVDILQNAFTLVLLQRSLR